MDTARILFYRNLLLRCFLVGIGFAIILFALTFALWDVWMSLAASMFRLEPTEVSEAVLGSLISIRLILIFFFLTPALALNWMAKGNKPAA
jgi:hypothetical protein